jgi:hypothetical protein
VKHFTRKPSRQNNKEEGLEEEADKSTKGIHRNNECSRNKKENERYPKCMTGNNTEEDLGGVQDKLETNSACPEKRINAMEYERHTQQ